MLTKSAANANSSSLNFNSLSFTTCLLSNMNHIVEMSQCLLEIFFSVEAAKKQFKNGKETIFHPTQ